MSFGLNDNPVAQPIPTASAWTAPSWVAATTYPAGVGGVAVAGSYVQYLGIVYSIPGAVASTPGTPPPGGVWVVSGNPDPLQSQFSNANFYATPLQTAVDVPGCPFYIPDVQSVPITTGVYIPAPGRGLVTCNGAGLLQYQIGALGTWVTVFTFSATVGVYVMADGGNVRFANTTAGILLFTFYRERSSKQ